MEMLENENRFGGKLEYAIQLLGLDGLHGELYLNLKLWD